MITHIYNKLATRMGSPLDNPLLKAFYNRINELSIHRGCLMWGIRVVIPVKLRRQVLDLLHTSHPEIVKMKLLARSYVWWPGIDKDIEILVKQCSGCQMQQKEPQSCNLHPWEWPSSPWERFHVDFAGPFLNKMFFVVVDAHSKWPEIVTMNSTTAERTIEELRTIFARNGLPKQLVSDNGVQFTSEIFKKFMKDNGILHLRTAPFKPSTNGLVERLIGTFKSSMRAMTMSSNDINLKVNTFLIRYRNTPHAITGESPLKLFLGINLRTRLDLLKPDTKQAVSNSQRKLALNDDRKLREFEIGDNVLARDYRAKGKWLPGSIVSRQGQVMYKVDVGNGIILRRHINQLKRSEFYEIPTRSSHTDNVLPTPHMSSEQIPETDSQASNGNNPPPLSENAHENVNTPITTNYDKQVDIPSSGDKRYPTRVRKAPDRLNL